MIPKDVKLKGGKLPDFPGVYLFKDEKGGALYVGKAGNLRRRVASYFMRVHDSRIETLVAKVRKIDYKITDSALEALILEAELIKKYKPPFNVREKDDKSFLYVEITNEKFPRVLLVRGNHVVKETAGSEYAAARGKRDGRQARIFGPFTSAASIREALKILRKIFPWSAHATASDKRHMISRPCFDYEIGLCPGTCIGAISREDYMKNIRNLKLFFEGKKGKILRSLEKEMAAASKKLEFEKAEKFRRQIFSLRHIRDTALISDSVLPPTTYRPRAPRIEGYDISNISGTSAVGSMVVFRGSVPDKNEYRRFKIRTITQPDDVGMLREVLRRRFHNDWPLPDLILIDGGKGQVNTAKKILEEFSLKIPVVGIAKGAKRKKNEFVGDVPSWIGEKTLIQVRNEAHWFAISYHRKLRNMLI
jgi:excinuclease ABC subunit C